jgi:hypothetical protein
MLIAGRHRLYATSTINHQPEIEARIIPDVDDYEARMAMIAENLWRNPLKKSQHLLAIKLWYEHFNARHRQTGGAWTPDAPTSPNRSGADCTGTSAAAEGDEDERATRENNAEREAAQSEERAKPGGRTNFARNLSSTTGMTEDQAKRSLKIAKAFDAEQLEVLGQMGVTQADMSAVAGIKDKTQRGQVVSLIASGMEPAAAIESVLGEEAAHIKDTSGVSAHEKVEAKETQAPELSDEDWYQQQCAEKGRLLASDVKYKSDALLFRRINDARHAFRKRIKNGVLQHKQAGVVGTFYYSLIRVTSASHPKDWLICSQCRGTGKDETGKPCGPCIGGGYKIKTEEYK